MRNPLLIPFTTVNYLSDRVLQNTDTSSYLQLSTISSDCILQTQLPAAYLQLSTTSSHCVLLNTDTYYYSYSQPSITSSDCVLLQAADVGILGTFTFASIIPSCSFTIASIIPSCSFPFLRVIPTLFSFLLKIFYFTCSCYFFDHCQFELISCILC